MQAETEEFHIHWLTLIFNLFSYDGRNGHGYGNDVGVWNLNFYHSHIANHMAC